MLLLFVISVVSASASPGFYGASTISPLGPTVAPLGPTVTPLPHPGLGPPVHKHYPKYKFAYQVNDPYTHNHHGRQEERDGAVVRGSYWVLEPTGTLRKVTYIADQFGFHPTVEKIPNAGPKAPIIPHKPPPFAHVTTPLPPVVKPVANKQIANIPFAPNHGVASPISIGSGKAFGAGRAFGIGRGFGVGRGFGGFPSFGGYFGRPYRLATASRIIPVYASPYLPFRLY